MNSRHRAIRALLQTMAPSWAAAYIRSFGLPEALLERDVRGKSYVQIAMERNTTAEAIKRRRRRAYAKIVDEIDHREGPRG